MQVITGEVIFIGTTLLFDYVKAYRMMPLPLGEDAR
jgi:hypothetical protein